MNFGNILKKLRLDAGKTQIDMAAYLGIKPRSFQRYEAGDREPNFADLIRIALFFGVTADYLLGLSDDPKKSKAHKAGTDIEGVLKNNDK